MAEISVGAFEKAIGHYMAVVAEKLLADGVPVSSVSSYGHYDDDEKDQVKSREDVEGTIYFNDSFVRRFLPTGEAGLHWSGTSGWGLWILPSPTHGGPFYDGARWLGAGLLPDAGRVAEFVSTLQLDIHNAGSSDRPFYRQVREDLPGLLDRLLPFQHSADDWAHRYRYRFEVAQQLAYKCRVVGALTAGNDEIVQIALRRGDLQAVLHLLEFAEGHAGRPLGRLAEHLSADLAQSGEGRSVGPTGQALTYARELEETRRKKKDMK